VSGREHRGDRMRSSAPGDVEILFSERVGRRFQAGVRCVRCRRVIAVEWNEADVAVVAASGRRHVLGKCDSCYRRAPGTGSRARAHRADATDAGGHVWDAGYIYVTLSQEGRLACGSLRRDACQDLPALVSGVASCGCCLVTLVACGGCDVPVPAVHRAPEELDGAARCGYCLHCERIISVQSDGDGGLTFSDRVASPKEARSTTWRLWRETLHREMHDVDGWTTEQDELSDDVLRLVGLDRADIEYIGREGRQTWESWLTGFSGGREGAGRDGGAGERG